MKVLALLDAGPEGVADSAVGEGHDAERQSVEDAEPVEMVESLVNRQWGQHWATLPLVPFRRLRHLVKHDTKTLEYIYPAAKWVPSINKAVLRACALCAASCSGISPGGLKWFPRVQAC